MTHAVADHLWQSTLFVAAAAALAALCSSARVRYTIWLAASIKFLVPFAIFAGVGGLLAELVPRPSVSQELLSTMAPMAAPFQASAAPEGPIGVAPRPHSWAALALGVWATGTLIVVVGFLVRRSRIAAAVRDAVPLALDCPIPAVAPRARLGPAVVGVFRPTLLVPHDIAQRLGPEELAAVVAHELWHVRRRDNLTAALHSAVEAAFWFHPLVWWLGARLLETREQACDEAVIAAGRDRHTYAAAIVKVSGLYAASPAAAAGASGGDLARRIAAIMTQVATPVSSLPQRVLVGSWLLAAAVVPFVAGLGNAQSRDAAASPPVFEELSLRRATGPRQMLFTDSPNSRISGRGSLKDLIALAGYADVPMEQIVGGPDWLDRYGFEITLAVKPGADRAAALRYALDQRFKLAVRVETDPVYMLEVAPGGSALRESTPEAARSPSSVEVPGSFTFRGMTTRSLAVALSHHTERPVLDHTGLDALYDFDFSWDVATAFVAADERSARAHLAKVLDEALQRQLGLRLRSFDVQTLVVDRAELPADD